MGEFNLSRIQGENTGLHGHERAMYEHAQDPDLLIGIENETRSPLEMRLYYLTGNILREIFPDNFPKIVTTHTDESTQQSYAVVAKVKAERIGFGQEYQSAKEKFLQTIKTIFPEQDHAQVIDAFDFNGTNPNLLIDKEGNPVYVDKVKPHILRIIDRSVLFEKVGGEKARLIESLIDKAIKVSDDWSKLKREIDEIMGEI